MDKIPLKIHLLFLNKIEPLPKEFIICYEKIKELHPTWEINLYNEDDAQNIIDTYFPQILPIYNSYNFIVQRSDLLRVLLIYIFGGFYLDLDMICFKNLDELREYNLVLGEEKTIGKLELEQLKLKYSLRIANYMFGSIPKHPFWLIFLKEAIKKARQNILTENDILETTGPGLLTNVYHKFGSKYHNITVLFNKDKQCLIPNHKAISCHFGNFAAHLHCGTWRWAKRENIILSRKLFSEIEYKTAIADINNRLKMKSS